MKKAMICQPMSGKTEEEIFEERKQAVSFLRNKGYEIADTFINDHRFDESNNPPLAYLAESLKLMAEVDAVYFVKGWEKKRGCRIEHEAAVEYLIDIFYE